MEEKNRGVFHSEAYRIKLISNNQGYGPMPDPAQEIEQRLTLSSTGKVWLSGYGMNMDGTVSMLRRLQFTIDSKIASDLINQISDYFSKEHDVLFVTDVGNWELELFNQNQEKFKFWGPLVPTEETMLMEVSRQLREYVRCDLFGFDGGSLVE